MIHSPVACSVVVRSSALRWPGGRAVIAVAGRFIRLWPWSTIVAVMTLPTFPMSKRARRLADPYEAGSARDVDLREVPADAPTLPARVDDPPPDLGAEFEPLSPAAGDAIARAVSLAIGNQLGMFRPEPLRLQGAALADPAGVAVIELPQVPVATQWRLGDLHVNHDEVGAIDVSFYLGYVAPGNMLGGVSALPAIGATREFRRLLLRESEVLIVRGSGLPAGAPLRVYGVGTYQSVR